MDKTTCLDGTSLTNAYSCCRLLWTRDRAGRKVLRSAQTSTDHLYHAIEDVWLVDVSTNGLYRVTQHFHDALGRETNTVVYAGTTPGEATAAAASEGRAHSTVTTAYPCGGSDYAVRTDERGRVTTTETVPFDGGTETSEAVFTNNVVVMRMVRRSHFGGGTSVRREWPCGGAGCPALPDANSVGRDGDVAPQTTAWTEERRFTDYAAEGGRVEYVVTESSDCGVVTNSVSTYDLLGRLVSSASRGTAIHSLPRSTA